MVEAETRRLEDFFPTKKHRREITGFFHPVRRRWDADWCRQERTVNYAFQLTERPCMVLDSSASVNRVAVTVEETVQEKFLRLADEWSAAVGNVSSLTAMAAHPKYREIIGLGWKVVPFLLADLRDNKRFWFPALAEITTVRPFDQHDAGNSRKMVEAWIRWGKKKNLI